MILGGVGLAEATMGTWRAALAFVAGHMVCLVLLSAVIEAGSALGSDWLAHMKTAVVTGPYAGSLATAVAASPLLGPLVRRRLRSVTLAVTLMLLLYVGHAPALNTFLGVLAGFALGSIMHPAPVSAPRFRSRETRALLSMMVAVFAAGPAVAAVAQAPAGPLTPLGDMIVNPLPTTGQLRASCHAAVGMNCGEVMHSAGLRGPGGLLLSLTPLLMLLVCAEGLRIGNRLALWVTVGVHLVIGVLSAFHLQMFSLFGTHMRTDGRTVPVAAGTIEVLPVVLVPFVIVAALLANRRHFIVDPDPVLRRRTAVLLPSLLAIFVLAYVIAWFAEENYRRKAGLLALPATVPRMFLPYPFSFRYSVSVHPHGHFSTLIFSYGGAVFWLTCVVSMLLLFHSRTLRITRESDLAAARELVRYGGTTLSWMALWPNNSYWFNNSRTAGVAYRVHSNVALTLGGPFGHPGDAAGAAVEFTRFCASQSLTPCWYSVTDGTCGHLTGLGFRRFAVAEETLLPIRDLEFKGKDWQNVRTALNRARKSGISAQWSTYGCLDAGLRTQVNEISEAWARQKALPEMGFTLGGLEELKDDNVLLGLAVDRHGKVHAITSWLPVFHEGRIISRTLDVMRRDPQAIPGAMEFLIASATSHFKDTLDMISLSASPLAKPAPTARHLPEGPAGGSDAMSRFIHFLGGTLEPVYGFRSLSAFKARFRPRTRSLYLLYQDPLLLPTIGWALAHAYIPNISMRRTAKMLRQTVS
jgi:lysylphosphatidylglycerol synthetase-like protein (DUF2156 family)